MVLRTFNLRIFPFEMNFRAEESIFLLYFFFLLLFCLCISSTLSFPLQ